MKPFEYRGINPASNEWVYGHYALIHDGQGNDVDCIWIPGTERGVPIIPETLGVKVGDYYVGDKVICKNYHGEVEGTIDFYGSTFYLACSSGHSDEYLMNCWSPKVVGTIHDHLLKENNND